MPVDDRLNIAILPLRQRFVLNNMTSTNYTWETSSNVCCYGNFSDYDALQHESAGYLSWFQYIAWGITGNIISAFGLIGNLFSVIVLANRRMKSSTSCYLIALAVFDSIVLISLVLFLALPSISFQTGQIAGYTRLYPYMQPYAYPTALTAQTCSIYTTVAFTVERFIAVCWPLRAAKMCTISRSRKAILIIVACSFIYNVPRMFEYRVIETWDPITNYTRVSYELTELGVNPTYRHVYFIYMHIFFMLLIPFITLAVLNTMLIRAVKQSEHAKGKVNNKAKRENSLTIMLISVIIVFLICQVPSIVDNILMATLSPDILQTAPLVKLTCISSLMVITNSAVNFYLYCVFGRKFRRVFCRIFCQCLPTTKRYLESETSLLHAPSMRNAHRNGYPVNTRPNSRMEGSLSPRLHLSPKLQMSVYENGKTKTVCSGEHPPYARMDSAQSQTSQL